MKQKHINFSIKSYIRPTKNNVREKFFSWIILYLDKLYVLDLFAGSGVFGFEFLSIGAKKIIMIENNNFAYKSILKNSKFFKIFILKYYIFFSDSLKWMKMFNFLNISLIIFDPPYIFHHFKLYFLLLEKTIFFKKCLLIFIETNSKVILEEIPFTWFLLKKGYTGKTHFYLFKKL